MPLGIPAVRSCQLERLPLITTCNSITSSTTQFQNQPLLYPLFSRLPIHLRVLLFIHVFFFLNLSVCVYRKSRSVITSTILQMHLRIFMSGFGAQKICLSLFARQRRRPSQIFCLSLVRFITGCFTFTMELSVIFSIISHSILMRCF